MKHIGLVLLLLLSLGTFAQDETIKGLKSDASRKIPKATRDSTDTAWKRGGLYNLNLSQGSLSNWAAGGDDFSLSVTSVLSLFASYETDRYSWDNTLDFNLGYLRTTSQGGRKNDDRIDLVSKFGRAISSDWNTSFLFNFRSQILPGYDYDGESKTLTSTFLAPAYVLTSLGMDYKPNDRFSLFLSPVTARWIIVKDDSLSAKGLYGVEPGRHTATELGAFITANYLTDPERPVSYKGRLDLYSNYRHNPQNIDVFMSHVVSVKLTKALAATWNVDLIYDDDVRIFGKGGTSPALQLKSLVGAGLMLKF